MQRTAVIIGSGPGGGAAAVRLAQRGVTRVVLLDKDHIFSARRPWMMIMGKIFPNGLLLRDGAAHRHHRKIMHEAFKRPVLREYVERMNPAVERGLVAFGGGRGSRVRAFDAFKALTLDIAASIFVGVDLGRESRRMTEAFEAMVAAAMPGPKIPFFGRHHRGVVGRRYLLDLLRANKISVETALTAASNPTDFRTKLALEGGDPDAVEDEADAKVEGPFEIDPDTRF